MAGRTLTLTAKLLADSKAFTSGMGKAQDATQSLSSAAGKIGDRMKKLAVPVAIAGAAVVALGTKFVGLAAEAEQNLGGAEAVFGKYADEIKKKGSDAYKTLGLSQSDYLSTANKMGSLFQGSGITQQESLKMTSDAMQRAADVASVMGIDVGAAMESVTGAAKGNFTMMDNLGVAMNATSIEAYAVSKGMVGFSYATATTAEKTSLAMEMFMDKTSQYAGTFSKELNTMSGVQDMLKAKFENFGVSIGTKLLPTLTALAHGLSVVMDWVEAKLMPAIGKLGQAFIGPLKEAFSGAGIDAGALGQTIGDTILDAISKLTEIVDVVLPKLIAFGEWVSSNVDVWGPFAAAITGVVLAVQAITLATELWAVAQGVFNVVMAMNPIMLVVLAVIALTAAIIYVATQTTFFQDTWAKVCSFISGLVGNLGDFFRTVFGAIGSFVSGVVTNIGNFFRTVFGEIGSFIGSVVNGIKAVFSVGFSWIVSIIAGHINNIRNTIGLITGVVSIVGDNIRNIFIGAFNTVSGFVLPVIDGIVSAFTNVTNSVIGAYNWVRNLFNGFSVPGWLSKVMNFMGGGATGFSIAGGFDMSGLDVGLGATGSILSLGGSGGRGSGPSVTENNYNITVNGALDPIAVARQIKQIINADDIRNGKIVVGGSRW